MSPVVSSVVASCMLISLANAQGVARVGVRLSPVPVLVDPSAVPETLRDHFVFLRADGEYVVSYPQDLATNANTASGPRRTVEIDFPNGSRPALFANVRRLASGQYRYEYRIANGAEARQSIESFALELLSIEAGNGTQLVAAPAGWTMRPTVAQNSPSLLEFNLGVEHINAGAAGRDLALESIAKPGICIVRVRGHRQRSGALAELPQVVKDQVDAVERQGLSCVNTFAIGPKHPRTRSYYLLAVDFKMMIEQLLLTQQLQPSAFVKQLIDELTSYLESTKTEISDIETASFSPPSLNMLAKPKTASEIQIYNALKVSLDVP